MSELDINAALTFLDRLDRGGRHALASEAPFGRDGLPKWEGGGTYEAHQRDWLIADIKKRQARGSNVYYSVNRPCSAGEQQGFNGKCNVDDIIAIRALAFDIDIIKRPFDPAHLFGFIDRTLVGALRPSEAPIDENWVRRNNGQLWAQVYKDMEQLRSDYLEEMRRKGISEEYPKYLELPRDMWAEAEKRQGVSMVVNEPLEDWVPDIIFQNFVVWPLKGTKGKKSIHFLTGMLLNGFVIRDIIQFLTKLLHMLLINT
jgi:hypothetical protein